MDSSTSGSRNSKSSKNKNRPRDSGLGGFWREAALAGDVQLGGAGGDVVLARLLDPTTGDARAQDRREVRTRVHRGRGGRGAAGRAVGTVGLDHVVVDLGLLHLAGLLAVERSIVPITHSISP
jgi:hypothetical protein